VRERGDTIDVIEREREEKQMMQVRDGEERSSM